MDKTNNMTSKNHTFLSLFTLEEYLGAWIDNNDGVYTQDEISEKMRQIALQLGVPKSKLPTMEECSWTGDFLEHHNEIHRELEELLNEYCTTELTCWYWHEDAFGLWANNEKEA
jgi:hypothetical protein